jgi:hypothetical protein
MQELFRYDESWTGTEGSGGSGHSAAQAEAALVEERFLFEGPCSLMVSVNEAYAVVLEGQEQGEAKHELMGIYERMKGRIRARGGQGGGWEGHAAGAGRHWFLHVLQQQQQGRTWRQITGGPALLSTAPLPHLIWPLGNGGPPTAQPLLSRS